MTPPRLSREREAEIRRNAPWEHGFDHESRHAVTELLAELTAVRAEREAARAFVRWIVLATLDGSDPDGGGVQDKAVEAGILEPVNVTEPCGENCMCAEWDDTFPQTCYRLAASYAALAAEAQREGRSDAR